MPSAREQVWLYDLARLPSHMGTKRFGHSLIKPKLGHGEEFRPRR